VPRWSLPTISSVTGLNRATAFGDTPFVSALCLSHCDKERLMPPPKTLQEREKELQALLATPAGQRELSELEARYQKASARLKPGRMSAITYILVHERNQGLISR